MRTTAVAACGEPKGEIQLHFPVLGQAQLIMRLGPHRGDVADEGQRRYIPKVASLSSLEGEHHITEKL